MKQQLLKKTSLSLLVTGQILSLSLPSLIYGEEVVDEPHPVMREFSEKYPDQKWKDPNFYRSIFDGDLGIKPEEGEVRKKDLSEEELKKVKEAFEKDKSSQGIPEKGSDEYFLFYQGMEQRLYYVLNDVMAYLSGVDSNPIMNPSWPETITAKNKKDWYLSDKLESLQRIDPIYAYEEEEKEGLGDDEYGERFKLSEQFFASKTLAMDFFNAMNQSSLFGYRFFNGNPNGEDVNKDNKETYFGKKYVDEVPIAGSPYFITEGPFFQDMTDPEQVGKNPKGIPDRKKKDLTPEEEAKYQADLRKVGNLHIRATVPFAISGKNENGDDYTLHYKKAYYDVYFNSQGEIIHFEVGGVSPTE